MPSKTDPVKVKTWLAEDAAEAQRQKGQLPTPRKNEDYLVGVLDKLDKKQRDAKPKTTKATKVEPDGKPQGAFQQELERRAAAKGMEAPDPSSYQITRDDGTTDSLGGMFKTTVDSPLLQLLRKRVRLLMSKPDWRAKLELMNPLAWTGDLGAEKQRSAKVYFWQVIQASDKVFGDWAKVKDKPLWFNG